MEFLLVAPGVLQGSVDGPLPSSGCVLAQSTCKLHCSDPFGQSLFSSCLPPSLNIHSQLRKEQARNFHSNLHILLSLVLLLSNKLIAERKGFTVQYILENEYS